MAEGRSNAAIAQRLFVTEKAVSKHAAGIFAKLDLAPSDDDNRRVLAVLAYLESLMNSELMRAAEAAPGFMPPAEGLALFDAASPVCARRPGPGDRQLLRQVHHLPGRRGPRRRPAGRHRRPPPRLRGTPARLGVPRPPPGRPGHRPPGHPAEPARHPGRRRPGGQRGRGRRPLRRRGPPLGHPAGPGLHRRRPHRSRRGHRLRGLGPLGRPRRRPGHPRRLPRPRRRRPPALPDLPASPILRRLHRSPRPRFPPPPRTHSPAPPSPHHPLARPPTTASPALV